MKVKNLAIFASGSGTNADKIIDYFSDREDVKIHTVYTNKIGIGALDVAKKHNIPSLPFNKSEFYESDTIIKDLQMKNTSLIVLAGFLWLIPKSLIRAYKDKIINIHPALLPDYGGKGMYGMKVHSAVSENGDSETGITVHFVNEKYDEGAIISQIRCPIHPHDAPDNIANKVQKVEHEYFPMIIDQLLENKYFEGY